MINTFFNTITVKPNFNGIIDPEVLSRLFSCGIQADEMRPLLRQYQNVVFHCTGMRLCEAVGGKCLQVDQVDFGYEGHIFQGTNLLFEPLNEVTSLYLHVEVETLPIGEKSAFERHSGKVFLRTDEYCDGLRGLPFVRFKKNNNGLIISTDFWAETCRITSDDRSRLAFKRLYGLLPEHTPLLIYFNCNAGRFSWNDVLPEVIRLLTARYETSRQKMAALHEAVAQKSTAETVSSMIRLLELEREMPLVIQKYHFVSGLNLDTVETVALGNKITWHFPPQHTAGKTQSVMLVVKTEVNANNGICHATLTTDGQSIQRPIQSNKPNLIGDCAPEKPFQLELSGGKLTHAAFYRT